ncbi:signal transduction histidine kinase [Corynebacterium mustelae]|uniref:histidine kinase n=1 Tax=Corynebacterium mustelae TaxID=571915 RepID=A0A0G3H0I0_9CORY|nr:HAMP domain-containing sensor histidine kinase [Corynebacterium mustelae]AKK06911.1 signal transduction histidine kinase [Corynebacterium mustelae]
MSITPDSAEHAPERRRKAVTRAPREYRAGLPLRSGLVFVTVIVAAMGLLASAIGIQQTMYDVTFSRVDEDLQKGLNTWAKQDELFQEDFAKDFVLPSEFFVYRHYADGSYTAINAGGGGPDLPDIRQVYFTTEPQIITSIDPKKSSSQWRVVADTYKDSIIVVGKRIDHEHLLLRRLAMGQLIIGLIVVLLIGVVSYFIIRHTLRPLRAVEETAKAIATGDLDRRAPVLPENTEVGALSRSINVMLEQLQSLIVELQAKETQMRRFVGDASHELRTPLTSLKGYAELYRSGATDNVGMVIEKIEEEAGRMGLLVEDLLSLTRCEEARFEHAPVDMLEVGLAVTRSLRGAYPDRHIDVVNNAAEAPTVTGDAARLHQVLTNLVVNALKHGGEEADVKLVVDTSETEVILDVIDNGIGMSEEDASHIFERFYRADTSRTRATGGSGLGLAIVKSIVESHDGTVTVDTTLGEGTTFTLRLPKRTI